jgi:hypothetical protein
MTVTISAKTRIPAGTSNAREKPAASACRQIAAARLPAAGCPGGPARAAMAAAAAWLRMLSATAVQATVPSTASPIEPPAGWPAGGCWLARGQRPGPALPDAGSGGHSRLLR